MDYSDKFMDIGLPSCGQKEKEILLARAKMEKDIIAADGTLTEKYCLIKEFVEGTSDVVYCRWLLMRVKYTQDAYANYCLEIMRNEAVEKIKFRQVQGKDEVPSSLRILLPGANPAAEEQLWEHYFHVSAIDNDPIEKYSRQPLGYYLNDYFLAIGMCLDENPKDPRVMFPNTKSGN
jgi:hypothetical protein